MLCEYHHSKFKRLAGGENVGWESKKKVKALLGFFKELWTGGALSTYCMTVSTTPFLFFV